MRLIDGILLLLLTLLFAFQLFLLNRRRKNGCQSCPFAENCAKRRAGRHK